LLLRVVAPAGALASLLACSSTAPTRALGPDGIVANPTMDDGGSEDGGEGVGDMGLVMGSAPAYGTLPSGSSSGGIVSSSSGSSSGAPYDDEDAGIEDAAYGIIVTGVSDSGDDAGENTDARVGLTGSVIEPDGGAEASGPCGGGVCGIIVHPDGG
jgi:hypothetical protein